MARENALLTVAQAARRLGVSPNTIRAWADRGAIPVVRLPSGHRRFEARAIDAVREHAPTDESYESAQAAWVAAGERWARTHRTKLSPEERDRGLAAVAEMTRLSREIAARHGNVRDIDSVDLIHQIREERTNELMRAVQGE